MHNPESAEPLSADAVDEIGASERVAAPRLARRRGVDVKGVQVPVRCSARLRDTVRTSNAHRLRCFRTSHPLLHGEGSSATGRCATYQLSPSLTMSSSHHFADKSRTSGFGAPRQPPKNTMTRALALVKQCRTGDPRPSRERTVSCCTSIELTVPVAPAVAKVAQDTNCEFEPMLARVPSASASAGSP